MRNCSTTCRGQARLNVDETGHKHERPPACGPGASGPGCTRCSRSTRPRSGDVLIEVLGTEFDGVLGCDYFSAYRRYMREFGVMLQFCLAHLIRDVKFLTDAARRAGPGLWRAAARGVAAAVRGDPPPGGAVRRGVPETNWRRRGRGAATRRPSDVPATSHSRNLAKRFETHGESYFRFVTTPGVEPTNNLAEQAIRFVVIDRLITQGTRSESGQPLVRADLDGDRDCAQQGRSVFDYLRAAVAAYFDGTAPPSLSPNSS